MSVVLSYCGDLKSKKGYVEYNLINDLKGWETLVSSQRKKNILILVRAINQVC
jgi:hypothetical protein